MNKLSRIIYKFTIGGNIVAGLINLLIIHNYILGVNQLLVAWFMFMYYNERNK
jgi:hypothetical protein